MTFAQTNQASPAVSIEWSNSTDLLFSYELRVVRNNRVEVVLLVKQKHLTTCIMPLPGEPDSLIRLAVKACEELEHKKPEVVVSGTPGETYRFTMRVGVNGGQTITSVQGHRPQLNRALRESIAVKEILTLCSAGQPKSYRLIDESGPLKQMLRLPEDKTHGSSPGEADLTANLARSLPHIKDAEPIRRASLTEVLGNRKEYQGKRISVEGYYKSAMEQSALYECEKDAETVRDDRSLWIEDVKPGCEDRVRWIREGRVRVIGTFEYQPNLGCGHFNRWPGKIKEVELFEALPPQEGDRPSTSRR